MFPAGFNLGNIINLKFEDSFIIYQPSMPKLYKYDMEEKEWIERVETVPTMVTHNLHKVVAFIVDNTGFGCAPLTG